MTAVLLFCGFSSRLDSFLCGVCVFCSWVRLIPWSIPQTKHICSTLKCVFPLLDSFQPCSKGTFLFLLFQSAGVRQGTDRRVWHSDKPHITERNLLRHGKGRRPGAVDLAHGHQVTKQSLRLVELRLILHLKVEVYHVCCVFPSLLFSFQNSCYTRMNCELLCRLGSFRSWSYIRTFIYCVVVSDAVMSKSGTHLAFS